MSRQRYVLGIDLGSGGPKVALISDVGEVVAVVRRNVGTTFLTGGGAEQDAEEWWEAIRDGARELMASGVVAAEDVVAISSAAQWSVTVPVDANGKVLGPAIHWLDQRGGKYTAELMNGWPKVSGYEATKLAKWLWKTAGVPQLNGQDVISHLLFLKNERPEVYEKAHAFLEPHDFIALRLTGKMAASYASIFPYFLANNRQATKVGYAEDLIARTGLDGSKLPTLVPVDHVLGNVTEEVARDWGLTTATKVVVGSGDSHAAVLGSGSVGMGDPHLCIGTSSWITCLLPRRKIDLGAGITSMPAVVPGHYMLAAEQGAAGKLLEMFIERWFARIAGTPRPGDADEHYLSLMQDAASVPAGSAGTMFLPWLNGAGPPLNDNRMRGGFLNLSLDTSPANAVRSVMEGVGFNLRWLMIAVEKMVGKRVKGMNFIGGGARSPVWCQILADVLGREIRQVADPHYAIVRGVGLMALMALKMVRLEEISAKVRIEQTFVPSPGNVAVYDRQFKEFLRVMRKTRPLFHRWNR